MESDLERIAKGELPKHSVTSKFINEYRELYDELAQKTAILATTCKKYFNQTE